MMPGLPTSLPWNDVVGLAGSFAILLAFYLAQTRRASATGIPYQLLNLFGALGILVSLIGKFNLPVALLESAWVAVSLYGIVRSLRERRA